MDIWLKVFLACVVIQNVQTQSRLVVNTTCLELAKPLNQQYRLICSQHDYHCLLDESYTQEFEVCREWKWINRGKCAIFNTYGSGNVDERQCELGINLTCSERISQFKSNSNIQWKCAIFNTYGSGNVDERQCELGINLTCSERISQFKSNSNIQFTACYAKRDSSTSLSTSTSPALVTSSNVTSNGDNSKSSVTSKAWIISLFTVIAVFLSIAAAILFIRRCMDKPLCKIAYQVKSQELSDKAMNEDTLEKQRFLRNETGDTSESPPTISHQDETITGARKSGNSDANEPADMNASDNLSEHYEDASSYLSSNKQINSEVSSEDTDDGQKEKSEKTASSSRFDSVTSDNEEEKDKKESTGVFDDTFESLQRKAPQTDAKRHEELYNLLNGGTLTKKVMAAVIKKITGKTAKELSDDENVHNRVQNLLNDGRTHISDMKEWESSIHVLYALLRIFLDEKYHPKSGWGNPVKDEDIGIGDDIDRLYRIFTITENISTPNMVSVESYNRLLDIMFKTCTRLDSHVDGQCKEFIKAFTSKCRSTSLTEKMNNMKAYISTYFYGNA